MSIAWDAFSNRNGSESYHDFRRLILNYRKDKLNQNPTIGCIVLTNPIFFKQEDWIETPKNWGMSIVQGKSYDTQDSIGRDIWNKVELLLHKYRFFNNDDISNDNLHLLKEESTEYAKSVLSKVRLGQGAFRVLITDVYSRRCTITGEKTLPVLDAAHIKPYSESGPNLISNGLLLRSDMHKLFDSGYLTITKELRIEVSPKIKEEFDNGKEYYKYHGKNLNFVPQDVNHRPNTNFIEWHNENIYKF